MKAPLPLAHQIGPHALATDKCAGSGKPYAAGSFRPANRTGRCPECLRDVRVTPTGTLQAHTRTGGRR